MIRVKDILLVEDNPYDVELMSFEFKKLHVANNLIVARTGEEALDYLYRQGKFQRRNPLNPALIILDIRLPKMNGIEVLHQIKNDAALRDIPVAIILAYPEARDVLDLGQLSVTLYKKPIDLEKLQTILRQASVLKGIEKQESIHRIGRQRIQKATASPTP